MAIGTGPLRPSNSRVSHCTYYEHDVVVSLGLCLIEVLSGKTVFHDIPQHETVFNKKMAGENPSIPVIKC